MENSAHPQRKRIRLPEFDYSSRGAYYLTVCVKDRRPVLSQIYKSPTGEAMVRLLSRGLSVERTILRIPKAYPDVTLYSYIIMPDHVHLVLGIGCNDSAQEALTQKSATNISTIMKSLKRITNHEIGEDLWQPRYHDHVIRSEQDLITKIQYVETNPLRYLLRSE